MATATQRYPIETWLPAYGRTEVSAVLQRNLLVGLAVATLVHAVVIGGYYLAVFLTSFMEKPKDPPSNLANMGVYLFNRDLLDKIMWDDHFNESSSHDFGKDVIPLLVRSKARVYAFPYTGYWMDVGTIQSYRQAHMDLLSPSPPLKLYNRSWVIHTRTEERPPARFPANARIYASMICDGCFIEEGAIVESSVLSPGAIVRSGAVVHESIISTDCVIENGAVVERAVLDKRVRVEQNARVGWGATNQNIRIAPTVNRLWSATNLRAGVAIRVPLGEARIVIVKSEFRLYYLFAGGYVRDFPVGLGREGTTPEGTFVIEEMIRNPDWHPRAGVIIPYGDPRNILGTRWLAFRDTAEHQGIGIHGTTEPSSLGMEASSGCVRMLRDDVERIFDWTSRGTSVTIVR